MGAFPAFALPSGFSLPSGHVRELQAAIFDVVGQRPGGPILLGPWSPLCLGPRTEPARAFDGVVSGFSM
jgi:hypothetical protein